ncbi:MAG: CDP-archaeol synthase, partial [Nanoarchaeota archaeon]|nr:CDP-archaeol synthase [Nanoarchaeota archaeon]
KNHLKFMAKPIAPRIKIRGKSLFGNHKTFRGLFVASLIGILVFLIQVLLFRYSTFQMISIFDYVLFFQRYNILPGFLLGFGAIFGDMFESMIKRQLNRPPGAKFIPWDQIDFVFGSLLFISLLYIPSWKAILIIFLVTPFGHIGMNHLAYYLKIKKVKW